MSKLEENNKLRKSKWKPHKYQDLDKGPEYLEKKECLEHGVYYGKFCLKCRMSKS